MRRCACIYIHGCGPVQDRAGQFSEALLDIDEAKKANQDLQAEFKPLQDQIDQLQRKLQDDQTMLQSSEGKLSRAKEAELSGDIQIEQHKITNMQQDLQDGFQSKQNEIVQRMGTRMTEVISKLRDEKGLDAILDTAAAIAYNKALDLTAEASAAYNKAYPPVSAAAAPGK